MITGNKTDITVIPGIPVSWEIIIQKSCNITICILLKITVILSTGLMIPQERMIAVIPMIQIEVHMKSRGIDRLPRITPLRHECRFRIVLIQHGTNLSPDLTGPRFLLIIILYQRICHIHTKAVTALIQPEPDNILQCLFRCLWSRIFRRHLPVFRRMQ